MFTCWSWPLLEPPWSRPPVLVALALVLAFVSNLALALALFSPFPREGQRIKRGDNDVYGATPSIAETSPRDHPDRRRGFPNPPHASKARNASQALARWDVGGEGCAGGAPSYDAQVRGGRA